MNTTDTRYIGDLGVAWCIKHHGIINEDTDQCDMIANDSAPYDPDDIDEDGEVLPCIPRPLVYVAEPDDGLAGDCEKDCQTTCAYPGQFSECSTS